MIFMLPGTLHFRCVPPPYPELTGADRDCGLVFSHIHYLSEFFYKKMTILIIIHTKERNNVLVTVFPVVVEI